MENLSVQIELSALTNRELLSKLYQYFVNGLVVKQEHPKLPLIIWNYSDKVQYKRLWDDFLIQCRGLITDTKGNLITKSFNKFFNFEEIQNKNDIPWNDSQVLIQDKIDGSLGILFNYNREWIVSTKGSFISDQCTKGIEILKSKYDLNKLDPHFTYLIEIVYPENRIVVEYEKENVIFLTIFNKNEELPWNECKVFLNLLGVKDEDIVPTVKSFKIDENVILNLKNKNEKNKEGYVLRFHPSNYRIKIKFEDYIKIHKILSGISTISIWEILKDGKDIVESLKDVPDETFKDIMSYISKLKENFEKIKNDIEKKYHNFQGEFSSRKEYAEWVKTHPKNIHSILFNILDNKDYDGLIWQLLKPEFKKI